MATSKVHRLQREAKESILEAAAEGRRLRARIAKLEAELEFEKDLRIAAQRGLVAYMKEHGLGARVGYDPDRDPAVWIHEHAGEEPLRPWWHRLKAVVAR